MKPSLSKFIAIILLTSFVSIDAAKLTVRNYTKNTVKAKALYSFFGSSFYSLEKEITPQGVNSFDSVILPIAGLKVNSTEKKISSYVTGEKAFEVLTDSNNA